MCDDVPYPIIQFLNEQGCISIIDSHSLLLKELHAATQKICTEHLSGLGWHWLTEVFVKNDCRTVVSVVCVVDSMISTMTECWICSSAQLRVI